MPQIRDNLYSNPVAEPGVFAFDDKVASVFPDMIKRSVPGYTTIVAMTGLLAARYATPTSQLYDLGCSLGASTLAMRQNIRHSDCRIVGVDNSTDMLKRCRTIIATDTSDVPVDLVCANVEDIRIEHASVVVLNFTLQFIPIDQRNTIIQRIYKGLQPGGIMVLSEKLVFEDPHLDALNIELHEKFKLANGYSELEVAQKRSALENVMLPETLSAHKLRMQEAGFASCDVWFQCFNFASLVALKQ